MLFRSIAIIRGIDTDPDKQQIVQNIVAYAHPRNMQIIAEGVETQKQAEFLRGINCCMAQGFLFDRPLPHDEYEKRLSGDHVYHISETE
mgnify:CR=1 FL=1